ncbi:hypothetical protein NEUTE1DRAFT_80396 [Neurospora tetrasperma FGSC 2508]|uniref:Uncharacterized protein n=1 Tax=Neurospora tetrasperma (strain FGSC 2508 / ATCC MYA-4615 / P0657) TaxID=510951 RepID=F8MJ63_NEUT8|nr:uncharacterized protein NEUTE1DRAFT_80396 [Neurospora tetrasperma FGSC 2508]EGO59907.1 hypothetical protein NEUTE1DRAFT_80396 [Neurospora tetrasperma FGSC 2508]EGZ74057.1 hypothetical protein NEUTE2DRAFT_149917 [Neurospora tetrasperma FGSC 2509]
MSASTNFTFPSHPTSRSHALQIVEGTRALEQSPLAPKSSSQSSPKKNHHYAESTTSTSSFSSRTSLLKDKFHSTFGSSSPSSEISKSKSKSNSKSKSMSSGMGSGKRFGLITLWSGQIVKSIDSEYGQ